MNRRWLLGAAALVVVASVVGVEAAPEDVAVGDIRSVVRREGTSLRTEPAPLAPRSATLPYGTRVRVEEVRAPWIRVSSLAAAGVASAAGWLRANETVQPYALTGAGQRGPAAGAGGASQFSASDVSAAGRQLDRSTEQGYRAAHPDLERAYPRVDEIELASRAVDEAAVAEFIRAGRLGRPGK